MARSANAIIATQAPKLNPFEDWASSFDDPTKNDVKRMVMRSDEAAGRFKGQLQHNSYHFKSRILPIYDSDEIYEARVKFSDPSPLIRKPFSNLRCSHAVARK